MSFTSKLTNPRSTLEAADLNHDLQEGVERELSKQGQGQLRHLIGLGQDGNTGLLQDIILGHR